MKKIGSISFAGGITLSIYYKKGARNPYRVYMEWYDIGPVKFIHRKRLQDAYADLNSAVCLIHSYALRNNEESRSA